MDISSLIEDHIDKTQQATKNAVVLEASKSLIRNYLLQSEDNPLKTLSLEGLFWCFIVGRTRHHQHFRFSNIILGILILVDEAKGCIAGENMTANKGLGLQG